MGVIDFYYILVPTCKYGQNELERKNDKKKWPNFYKHEDNLFIYLPKSVHTWEYTKIYHTDEASLNSR